MQPYLLLVDKLQASLLGGFGSGYRQPPLITLDSSTGTGAAFTCTVGAGGTLTGISVLSAISGYPENRYANISTTYTPSTGLLSITSNHGVETGDSIKLQTTVLYLRKFDGNSSQVTYPRSIDPASNKWLPATKVDDDT